MKACCECPECGYPRVYLIWDGMAHYWTGKCSSCESIVTATKDAVQFV